jgi:hypothetical protein
MRRLVAWALAVAGAAAGSACGSSPPSPQVERVAAASQPERVTGEYVVTLAASADSGIIRDVYGRFGIKNIKELAPGVVVVTLAEDPGPAAMEKLRAGNPDIKAVEPNFVYRTQGNP